MGDWKPYLLSDIIEIIGGGTPRTTNPEYWNGNIPWLSVADYNINRKYVKNTERKITKLGLEKSSTKLLYAGDVIISARGTVGIVAMLARIMAFNQTSYGIRAVKGITFNDYVYYLLKDTVEKFHKMAYGAVFDTITKNTFDEIEILLPPSSRAKSHRRGALQPGRQNRPAAPPECDHGSPRRNRVPPVVH